MNKLVFVVWLILFSGTTYAQSPNSIDKGTLIPVPNAAKAQEPAPKNAAQSELNQVFVKVIVPVTSRTPKRDGPVVESWVAEQLKQLGETEYFAVTDWVPVCDALFEDDIVDNHVWNGGLDGVYCPVGGDVPERKNGRLLVSVTGWSPAGGCGASITLSDEPGSRAVGPVQILVGSEKKPVKFKADERLPYVAVLICPPPEKPPVIDGMKSVPSRNAE